MPINNVSGAGQYTPSYGVNNNQSAATQMQEELAKSTAKQNQDSYVKSAKEQAVTYKPDMKKVSDMKASMNGNMAAFQAMVQGIAGKQINFSANVFQQLASITGNKNWEDDGSTDNDPMWGVEAVANRLVDFAKAISGGDPAKIDELRNAIKKGFGAAEKAWGKKMPSITGKTYDRTMELLDEWQNGTDVAPEE